MGSYNGNAAFVSIDGVDVGTKFSEVQLTASIGEEDVTVGSGATHVQRAPKLDDHAISLQLGYIATEVPGYIAGLKPGLHRVIVGPEGSTTGMPKHEQDFILNSNQFTVGVDKPEVVFDISGNAADAPVIDLFAGGTF